MSPTIFALQNLWRPWFVLFGAIVIAEYCDANRALDFRRQEAHKCCYQHLRSKPDKKTLRRLPRLVACLFRNNSLKRSLQKMQSFLYLQRAV